jgi:UDPglucose--hexose-1-phosphate uridylyltransferase
MLRFQKTIREARLLAPPGFEPEVQAIEYRDDPLTGSRTVINMMRSERPRQAELEEDPGDFIQSTREGCYFCPENREKSTPLMVKELSDKGRILINGSWVFPNRFPFAEYHAVATLTEEHFLEPDGFTPGCIIDNLKACREYALAVYESNSDARYPIWIWNYLPPSAGSMIHPHTQILVSREPTPHQRMLLHEGEAYLRENGTVYWDDLIESERGGERWIGEDGKLALMASFAPHGNREILFVFKDAACFTELDEKRSGCFARALARALHYYQSDGVNSFNLSTFSAGIGEEVNGYRLAAKIMSRPRFMPYYTAFGGPLEIWHDESVVDTLPEDVARGARQFF